MGVTKLNSLEKHNEGRFDQFDDDVPKIKVDLALAKKVTDIVSQGLCNGVGQPKPGQMCVEAAVCYAIGQKHSDQPVCVDEDLIAAKIELNDSFRGTAKERAKALRRVAIAQLGTRDVLNTQKTEKATSEALSNWIEYEFNRQIKSVKVDLSNRDQVEKTIDQLVVIRDKFDDTYVSDYTRFEEVFEVVSNVLGYDVKTTNKLRDQAIAISAEIIVQALKTVKAEGTKFLHLVPLTKDEQELFGVKG